MAIYKNINMSDIKNQSSSVSSEIERAITRAQFFVTQMASISAEDLTALGLSTDYQTNLGSMCTEITALANWYASNSTFIKRFTYLTV